MVSTMIETVEATKTSRLLGSAVWQALVNVGATDFWFAQKMGRLVAIDCLELRAMKSVTVLTMTVMGARMKVSVEESLA